MKYVQGRNLAAADLATITRSGAPPLDLSYGLIERDCIPATLPTHLLFVPTLACV